MSGDFAGTTQDFFQQFGTRPNFSDRLKSMVTAGAMLGAVLLSILAEIPSGPFDLLTSSDESKSEISSSLQSSPLGKVSGGVVRRKSVLSRGG